MSDDEIEELRKRRIRELQQRMSAEQQRAEAQQQLEVQKQAVLRQILTPEARSRLTNLKMVRPEFANQLELQLIQLTQQRRISIPITDQQLKELLARLQSGRHEFKIRRV